MRGKRATAMVLVLAACVVATSSGATTGGQDSSLITFWSDEPWPSIWTVRPDGSGLRRILRNRQNAKRPALSPDRGWIVFDGTPPGRTPMSDFEIQLVRRNGSGPANAHAIPTSGTRIRNGRRTERSSASRVRRRPSGRRHGSGRSAATAAGRSHSRVVSSAGGRPTGMQLVLDAPTTSSQGDLFLIDADGRNRRLLLGSRQLDQARIGHPTESESSSRASTRRIPPGASGSSASTARARSASRRGSREAGRPTARGSCTQSLSRAGSSS